MGDWTKNTNHTGISSFAGFAQLGIDDGFSRGIQWLLMSLIIMAVITLVVFPLTQYARLQKLNYITYWIWFKAKTWICFGWFIRLHLESFMFIALLAISELRSENSQVNHMGSYVFCCFTVMVHVLFLIFVPVHFICFREK